MLMQYNAVQIARRLDRATGIGIRRAHLAVANVLACGRPEYYRPDVLLLAMQEPEESPLDWDDYPTDAPGEDVDGVPQAEAARA